MPPGHVCHRPGARKWRLAKPFGRGTLLAARFCLAAAWEPAGGVSPHHEATRPRPAGGAGRATGATMRPYRVVLLLGMVAFLSLGGVAEAQVYRWLDEQGNVHYTQTPPPPAPVVTPNDLPLLVDEVLDVSGARRAILQIPAGVQAGFQVGVGPARSRIDPEAMARLSDILMRAFAADTFYARVRDTFVKQADRERLAAVLELVNSPLARQMTELELAVGTPDQRAELMAFVERFKASRPPEARLALIRRLDAATGATEVTIDVALVVIRSMARVIDASMPADKRLKPGELEAIIARTKASMYDAARLSSSIQLLFAYRSVSDKDLADYVALHETDAGRWFARVLHQSFIAAISVATASAAEEMTRAFPQTTQARP